MMSVRMTFALFFVFIKAEIIEALVDKAFLTESVHKNYVTAPGFAFTPEHITSAVKTRSECHCRNLCIVNPLCKGVSFDDAFMCSFSETSPESYTSTGVYEETDGHTLIFFTEDLEIEPSKIEFVNKYDRTYGYSWTALDYGMASAKCSSLPGFRLAVTNKWGQEETAFVEIGKQFGEFYLGLKKVNRQAKFVNGVIYERIYSTIVLQGTLDDTNKLCYKYKSETYNDQECSLELTYLCQAIYEPLFSGF